LRRQSILYNSDDTIAAVSTPAGEGGIGIVRLSGKKALVIADRIFLSKDNRNPSEFKTYTVHYGHIARRTCKKDNPGPTRYDIIDEVLLTVMRAPRSYTKEDVVEINSHGGIVPLKKILDLTLKMGARLAQPGEFTMRAFLNGRIDLTQAEAVLDIIRSKTENSMKIAVGQLEGKLSKEISGLKEGVLDVVSEVEAAIDFSEEEIEVSALGVLRKKLENIYNGLVRLIDESQKGIIMKEGIMCVICGKPNAGKSSLMNAFLKRNRVIVTPIPGTTRDAIEEEISLNGTPLRLVDTAGISVSKNIVEKHGVRKSRSYIKNANLIIFMLDLSEKWSEMDSRILSSVKNKNLILVGNKCDKKTKLDLNKVKSIFKKSEIVKISVLKKVNLGELEERILQKIWGGEVPHPEGAFVTNLRQKKSLENALLSLKRAMKHVLGEKHHSPELLASELKDALLHLDSVLGNNIEPDILGHIFSKFCVGK